MSIIEPNPSRRTRRYNVYVAEGVPMPELVAAIDNDKRGWVVSARRVFGSCLITVTGSPSDPNPTPTEGRVMHWLKVIADSVERRTGYEPLEPDTNHDSDTEEADTNHDPDAGQADPTSEPDIPVEFWLDTWDSSGLTIRFNRPLNPIHRRTLEGNFLVDEPDMEFDWTDGQTLVVANFTMGLRDLAGLVIEHLMKLGGAFLASEGFPIDELPTKAAANKPQPTRDTNAGANSPNTSAEVLPAGKYWRCTGIGGSTMHFMVAGDFGQFHVVQLLQHLGSENAAYFSWGPADGAPGAYFYIQAAVDPAETKRRRSVVKEAMAALGFAYHGKRAVTPRPYATAQSIIAHLGTILDPDQGATIQINPNGNIVVEVSND
jgi:hypothetical protein